MANQHARISTAPARRLAAVGKLARADEAEGMDVPRADRPWWQAKRRWLYGAIATLVALVAIFIAANLEPAIPSLPKESVWLGQVEQGEFVRDVRGPGTLAPMQLRWISAESPGRVQEILALPGIEVAPDTPLLRLDNPELEIQLLDAHQQLSNAAASLVRLRFQAESDRLAQVALIANVRTQYLEAKHRDEINRELRVEAPGLVADFDLARGEQLVQELANRMRIEARRLGVLGDSTDRQIAALEEQVERLQAIARFHEQRIASLNVTAGVAGVLAELPLQAGQSVQAGDILGRVVEPRRLKAEIRIPQGQAEGIAPWPAGDRGHTRPPHRGHRQPRRSHRAIRHRHHRHRPAGVAPSRSPPRHERGRHGDHRPHRQRHNNRPPPARETPHHRGHLPPARRRGRTRARAPGPSFRQQGGGVGGTRAR